jgi:hypothetical protein
MFMGGWLHPPAGAVRALIRAGSTPTRPGPGLGLLLSRPGDSGARGNSESAVL